MTLKKSKRGKVNRARLPTIPLWYHYGIVGKEMGKEMKKKKKKRNTTLIEQNIELTFSLRSRIGGLLCFFLHR